MVLLCVPDDAIATAAASIEPPAVLGHCSGACGLDVLGPRRGFSVHPLMTVTPAGADFRGVWAAVDGSDPGALDTARTLAGVVGLRAVRVADRDRVAYHAAASIAANYLITVEAAAAELLASAGLDRQVLVPLARAALENWARVGPAALTGPVARGDTGTVARHRAAVAERAPQLLELLDALVGATRRLVTEPVPVQAAADPAAGGEGARDG
ncbi:putative coenzyme F420-dependent NADP oxidoreductase [Nakamurella multipartita DSM 44233]|uniref:Putative coenzyme F420-dependent NADP oxidoreductase n=1 Tax=Nakamurella multipartita (strain ATCC 700099 / DSM 44233 / CIP 104796 / JCM 9543 / NBRC 105858 / Y-104) TaxID=479431 RepID=C8XKC7_NAKMY|nr:putative coenzyme F420-dependent NADP oxidoreductase [Nakamurella multipartita DSM 44233]